MIITRSLLLLCLVVTGCSPTSKDEKQTDSLAVTVDTTVALPVTEASAPETNTTPYRAQAYLPLRDIQALSEDTLEVALTDGLRELIDGYDEPSFFTISSEYTQSRDYEGDFGTVTEQETVEEKWYIDANDKLQAYTSEYRREGEGRDTKIELYLFKDDRLVAVVEDEMEDGQIGIYRRTVLLASKCPNCGLSLYTEVGAPPSINYMEIENLNSYEAEVKDRIPYLASHILEKREDAEKGNGFVTFQEEREGQNEYQGTVYTMYFTISEELFNGYLKKQIDNM